jgi:hypothetical protein
MGKKMQAQADQKQIKMAFIISLASGVLILLQGSLHIIRKQWALELGIGEIRRRSLGGVDFAVIGAICVVLGVTVILGAFLLRKPTRLREGGITVLAFSVLSILGGGGFLAGLILGVIGATIALSHYPLKTPEPKHE